MSDNVTKTGLEKKRDKLTTDPEAGVEPGLGSKVGKRKHLRAWLGAGRRRE